MLLDMMRNFETIINRIFEDQHYNQDLLKVDQLKVSEIAAIFYLYY